MSSTEAKDIMINYSVLALTRVLSHLEKSTSGDFSGEFFRLRQVDSTLMMALLKRPHLDKLTSIEQDVQAAMFGHPEL